MCVSPQYIYAWVNHIDHEWYLQPFTTTTTTFTPFQTELLYGI